MDDYLEHLNILLKTGELCSSLVRQYDLDKRFDAADFISLLYYQGIIMIWDRKYDSVIFKMPNYVIKQLYFQYFHQIILEQSQLDEKGINVKQKIIELADNNNMTPITKYGEAILQELALRDKSRSIGIDEKHIKIIFTSAFYASGIYTIHNEFEVKKGVTDKGFVDLLLIQRLPYKPKYQFVIEFKYVKKQDAPKAKKVKKEAIAQLKPYLKHDDYLQQLKNLKAYVVVFVGNKGEVIEVAVTT